MFNIHDSDLIFLKLGGSLITHKSRALTPRPQTIARLAAEIASAIAKRPSMRLVIAHGAGSFGHIAAHKYRTRERVSTQEEWIGFADVASNAARLTRLVFDALHKARVPVFNAQPSASAICHDTTITSYAVQPIDYALRSGLVPLLHGDVAFDTIRGGTIISTEEIFRYLTEQLRPSVILLAGFEHGVLDSYPHGETIPEITPGNISMLYSSLLPSSSPDVTGGMVSKVREMLALAEKHPDLQIHVFSGATPGAVQNALLGRETTATLIHAPAA